MSQPRTSTRKEEWPRHAAGAVRDLRGGMRLLVDALRKGVDQVEAVHARIASVEPPVRGARIGRPGSGVGAVMYRGLRGTTDLAGGALDLALASMQAFLLDPQRQRDPPEPVPAREAAVALLNAVAGDHLQRTGNPLEIRTEVRSNVLAQLPRVLVMAHDLGRNDLQWRQDGSDHGQALAETLVASPLYAVYNSGRAIGATGRELAAELEVLLAHWRVPLEGVVLLGHGMGGLVLRSALHQAQHSGLAWPAHVRRLVFLGTPHHGTDPAADLFSGLGFGPAAALSPLMQRARRRSPGMRDFLEGRVLEDDPRTGLAPAQEPLAGIPPGLPTYAIAGALGDRRSDGLVPVDSALGRHPGAGRDLLLPEDHRWVIEGVDHFGLLRSDAVLARMRQWLSA